MSTASIGHELKERAQGFEEGAVAAARSLRDSVAAVEPQIEELDRQLRDYAREHPLATIGAALALGYLAGRLVSRL